MTAEREPEQTFDSIVLAREQPDDKLTERQILDRKVKRITRTSRTAAIVALYGLATVTLAVNEDVIKEGMAATTSYNELNDEVSDIASELANSTIYVSCNDKYLNELDAISPLQEKDKLYVREAVAHPVSLPYNLGFVAPLTTLRESTCETIVNYNPAIPTDMSVNETAIAKHSETMAYAGGISVLLHEIEHTKEVRNEAEASCYAFQKLPDALEELGVDERYTRSVPGMVAYEKAQYSMSEYLSDECKPGGAYDLDINGVYFTEPKPIPEDLMPAAPSPAEPSS